MSGCSLHEEDDIFYNPSLTGNHSGVGEQAQSQNPGQGHADRIMRPGDGLSRDEKRILGSWAATGHSTQKSGEQFCVKCKLCLAKVIVRQDEAICPSCLQESIIQKVRSVKAKGALQAQDRVLVAVSGGPSSLAVLHALMQMQVPCGQRASKGKLPFDVVIAHVDETEVYSSSVAGGGGGDEVAEGSLSSTSSPAEVDFRKQCDVDADLKAAVSSAGFSGDEVHVVELSTIYDKGSESERRDRLKTLLQAATDLTGREDLVGLLRQMLLLRLAEKVSCNKVVTGDTSTSMAIRVIAETAKGRGYALAGSLQMLDARHGSHAAAHVMPMREVTRKEAVFLCRFQGIRTMRPTSSVMAGDDHALLDSIASMHSVNALAESFIGGLQANVPSTISVVMRTALNLQPFPWNQLPDPYELKGKVPPRVLNDVTKRTPVHQKVRLSSAGNNKASDEVSTARELSENSSLQHPASSGASQDVAAIGISLATDTEAAADSQQSPPESSVNGLPTDDHRHVSKGLRNRAVQKGGASYGVVEGDGSMSCFCALCSCPKGLGDHDSSGQPFSISRVHTNIAEVDELAAEPVDRVDLMSLVSKACCRSCRSQIIGPIQRYLMQRLRCSLASKAEVYIVQQLNTKLAEVIPELVLKKCILEYS
ncbi:hypothetical protein CEUSTIGMA_g9796.t1 [Chlamydomonas eustigma]|uniref:Cytoplasmic tRNA 2-thiolation protein 2 n=1 Tax=Chlamydomonas eustigma TaxID=1157962 RepID=A0A250XH14_9CHLO|nr:hypothetical protein CEUSTIGMA_g9796.t1 [Chlamydomonas eustigma]|eukprot:GAX82367.1 hypothetical protein CEUSTIGMA_g9796.t1 [Chlamydomonas eustigma]